jgi:prolyl-tRNA synthetase
MKDLYSFHATQKSFDDYYKKVGEAYEKIFRRLGLKTVYALAAGGAFTASNTHEFQVISPAGEDLIFVCSACQYAENSEASVMKEGDKCPQCQGRMVMEKSIEVGNIFPLGDKYAKAFNLRVPVIMGSYGIGLGRVMGTIVEVSCDERGIIWPQSVAPFKVHLIELGKSSAKNIYKDLQKNREEVLYDDRRVSAGEKLVDSDLLGIPWRFIVSEKTGDRVEVKRRNTNKAELVSYEDALKLLR